MPSAIGFSLLAFGPPAAQFWPIADSRQPIADVAVPVGGQVMPQFQLKPIDADAIPRALEKAERYRLLAEPEEAESICLDILAIEPDNQQALVMLLLALT